MCLTDQDRAEILRNLKRRTKELCRTPETARAYLVALGTHTPDGNLTPEFGGPGWEEFYAVDSIAGRR